jgi:hypothetical protein
MRAIITVALLAAGLASARHWEFEQVEPPGWGGGLRLRRHPSGNLCLLYSDTAGNLRLAWRDSAWHYEDAGVTAHAFDMNVSPSGTIGIVYTLEPIEALAYAVRTDSGWQAETLPCARVDPYSPPRVALDSADGPAVLVKTSDPEGIEAVLLLTRPGGTWRTDTLSYFTGQPSLLHAVCEMLTDSRGRPVGMYIKAVCGGEYREYLYVLRFFGDSIQHVSGYSSLESTIGATDLALDSLGRHGYTLCDNGQYWHATGYRGWDGGALLDTLEGVVSTAVAFDPLGRPHVAYTRAGTLHYLWRADTVWHRDTLPRAQATLWETTTSDSCQPIVAITSPQGLELARGVDVVGASERPQAPRAESPVRPSICRGVLVLPRDMTDFAGAKSDRVPRPVLLDISGRRVLDLHPGENDIRHLSPGIYFIRENETRTTRKVIVTH